MDYLKIYKNLINKAKNRKIKNGKYVEHHHIIPLSCGGTNDKSNIVELYPREHYLAHKLLYYIYPNNNSLMYAYCMMTFTTLKSYKKYKYTGTKRYYNITNREYEFCRNLLSTLPSPSLGKKYVNNGKINKLIKSEELNKYLSNGWKKGKIGFSEDGLKSIREKAKLRKGKLSLKTHIQKSESVIGSKNPCYGKKTINNGIKNKKVYPYELDKYLNNGWKLGQICLSEKSKTNKDKGYKKGNKAVNKGKVFVHTETTPYLVRCIDKEFIDFYINDLGWKIGRGKHIKLAKQNNELNKKYFYYRTNPYDLVSIPKELIPLFKSKGYKLGRKKFLANK